MASTAFAKVLDAEASRAGGVPAEDIERVVAALSGLRFGAVTVIVQDGFVVQVERTEKVRLIKRGPGLR